MDVRTLSAASMFFRSSPGFVLAHHLVAEMHAQYTFLYDLPLALLTFFELKYAVVLWGRFSFRKDPTNPVCPKRASMVTALLYCLSCIIAAKVNTNTDPMWLS